MSTNKVTIEIEMTDEMYEQMGTILGTREGRSQSSIDQQIFERGLYDMSYRTKRNQRVYGENKSMREEIKLLKQQLKG
jgi:hypothetical protein